MDEIKMIELLLNKFRCKISYILKCIFCLFDDSENLIGNKWLK